MTRIMTLDEIDIVTEAMCSEAIDKTEYLFNDLFKYLVDCDSMIIKT